MQPVTEMIQTLYRYNEWANNRILDTAENLTTEQFLAKVGASFDSVRDTLVHTMNVQRNWLARFQERALGEQMVFTDYPTLSAVRDAWRPINEQTNAFVAALTDEALLNIIEYTNSIGKDCAYTLWQMMTHQANHGTQHRSEVAVMLTQFGHSPGGLDFLVYIDAIPKQV